MAVWLQNKFALHVCIEATYSSLRHIVFVFRSIFCKYFHSWPTISNAGVNWKITKDSHTQKLDNYEYPSTRICYLISNSPSLVLRRWLRWRALQLLPEDFAASPSWPWKNFLGRFAGLASISELSAELAGLWSCLLSSSSVPLSSPPLTSNGFRLLVTMSQWTWRRDWTVWSEDLVCGFAAAVAVALPFHCWLTFSLRKIRKGVGSCERMRSWKLFRLGKSGGRSCEIGSHCCENLLPVEAGVEGGEQRSLQEFILWRYLLHRSIFIKELKALQSRVCILLVFDCSFQ